MEKFLKICDPKTVCKKQEKEDMKGYKRLKTFLLPEARRQREHSCIFNPICPYGAQHTRSI